MTECQAIQRIQAVIRLRHFSFSTEQSYCGWLRRFVRFLPKLPAPATSEQKAEAFLSDLARQGVSASTQNQAFSALLFFYQEVLGQSLKNIDALRARRPATLREAPTVEETRALLAEVRDVHGYPCPLIVRLLYGCGLRVTVRFKSGSPVLALNELCCAQTMASPATDPLRSVSRQAAVVPAPIMLVLC
jgi:site-specific recombinase XerD